MNRRAYLRAVAAAGAIGLTAGCLGDDKEATGSPATLSYPLFPPTMYDLTSERVRDPDGTPTPFAELLDEARLELATLVHPGVIQSGNPPALRDEAVGYVRYRDAVWGASGGVGDAFTQPEHGPEGDPDWEDPAPVRTSVDDGELTVTLSNALERDLPALPRTAGLRRPRGGRGVGDRPRPRRLRRQRPRADGRHRPGPAGTALGVRRDAASLAGRVPRGNLRNPGDLSGEATVRTAIWIGDDSFDMLDNRRQLLVATFTHEF